MISNLNILNWNCKGIMYGSPYLATLLPLLHIVVLTEHWLYPDSTSFLDSFDSNFSALTVCDKRLSIDYGPRRGCGGVAILYRKEFIVKPIPVNDRICGVQLLVSKDTYIFVFAVYMPCNTYPENIFLEYLDSLYEVYHKYKQLGTVVFAGDFNGHLSAKSGPRCSISPNSRGLKIEDWLLECNLFSVNSSDLADGPWFTFY
ncbi:unnamed protein product, partial [Owenia fusiformis]